MRVVRFFIQMLMLGILASCGNEHTHTAIAFYNCENLFDTVHDAGKQDEDFTPSGKYHYTQAIYNEKLHNIAAVLAKLVTDEMPQGPAMIGLAEIENDNVLEALVSQPAIARRHYRFVWFNGPDRRGVNVALLYDPKAFTVIEGAPLHVNLHDSGISKPTRDILYVYGVLYGDTVHVLVNHWPSRLGGEGASEPKRMAAATVCRGKMNALLQNGDKVVVMGDFNENPSDLGITNVLSSKTDSNVATNMELYNPYTPLYAAGQGTLIYQHKWYLFDQIMVSGGFLHKGKGYQLNKIEIFKPSFATDSRKINETAPRRSFAGTYWLHGYSDHFPVILYLKK
jgi:hypothetical protein